MKWEKSSGSVQQSSDGRYVIVRANESRPDWIAYLMGYTCGSELGTRRTDEEARQVCEAHEAHLQAAHRRQA
jgi:hypothetical protein